jgi:hypothetical protein
MDEVEVNTRNSSSGTGHRRQSLVLYVFSASHQVLQDRTLLRLC